jgi:drug/metabolite transporter (DMT)-like permease
MTSFERLRAETQAAQRYILSAPIVADVMTGRFDLDTSYLPGYLLMAGAALTWASYSLLTKRLPPFPTGAVGAFCLISGILSLSLFAMGGGFTRFSIDNITRSEWLALGLTGLGPMGAAFFTWDAALKRGDPRIIGSLAYLTPLTSTLVLVFLGGRSLTWISGTAMLLIIGGAVIGSLDLLSPRLQRRAL